MIVEAMVRIQQCLQRFWRGEDAQDLVEYTLILAIFVLSCFSIFGMFTPSIHGMWSTSGSALGSANSFAS
jgi:Flp pilus assembly pilin Flp